ncbi:MAG: ROK family transcriptional regulator [Comamonadaceae bacterium]|nr:MAG: ROK family transcriptional regulator [Comamonadaceae bacterium]
MNTTGDQQLVRRINRSVLLRLVRARPGLSRAQLAGHSGLTKSTVSLLVRELLDEGWLDEAAAAAIGLGRPSTPLRIHARSLGIVGVEVAIDCMRVVAVSLLGEVLWSSEQPLAGMAPAAVCAQAAGLARLAHDALGALGLRLSGVGVGLPGAFDDTTGVVRFAPNLGWRNVDFLTQITRALAQAGLPHVPVHTQNEADTAALSEYEFFGGDGEDAMVFVNCDVGVGAGIVLNDRLFAGAQGMAGEIGHTILQVGGPLCSCGRLGCAEAFIGARAIASNIAQLGGIGPAGHFLGVLLQNLWTTFNPSVLVVGGSSCARHPELVQMARDTLNAYAASAGMAAPVVRTARYGMLAPAAGAAALVLHQYLRPMQRRTQPNPELP